MKLWLIERCDDRANTWDEALGFVVRAESEGEARRAVFFSDATGDEGKDFWLDPVNARCTEISTDGSTEVLLASFHAA